MADGIDALFAHAAASPVKPAIIAGVTATNYGDLAAAVRAVGARALGLPGVVGLMASRDARGIAWDLGLAAAGRTVVPLPDFFSDAQLAHIARDAGLETVVCPAGARARLAGLGLPLVDPDDLAPTHAPVPRGIGRRIIYTSGSTGTPKGVLLDDRQLDASAAALAKAVGAHRSDRYLSVLPPALLLEQIAGIRVPLRTGASIHVCPHPSELITVAVRELATVTVLVPELLAAWTSGLGASGGRAPASLRFVAVGGAATPAALLLRAAAVGIPAFQGYGLSECCSVVAVNRADDNAVGTVGRPLDDIEVVIEDGEIVVSGPTVMAGYLHGPPAGGRWRTGDLGHFDGDGRLVVEGRRDSLIVTTTGRNVSPEWIETLILADPRIARCVVIAGASRPAVVLVPSPAGTGWFAAAAPGEIESLVTALCAEAPDYARPQGFFVRSERDLAALGLLTPNGRPRRQAIAAACKESALTPFITQLENDTTRERQAFVSIPIIADALAGRVTHRDYLEFLAAAYHHVRHTVPLLRLAAGHCRDEDAALLGALTAYIQEESGHEDWILDDIRALGGDAEAVAAGDGLLEVRVMVAYAYHLIERTSPYCLLGMVYVLEGMSVALAHAAEKAIRSSLGIEGDAGFSYLHSHGQLDQDHIAFLRRLLDKIDRPDRRRLVISAARDFYRLYGDIFRAIGAGREGLRHAA